LGARLEDICGPTQTADSLKVLQADEAAGIKPSLRGFLARFFHVSGNLDVLDAALGQRTDDVRAGLGADWRRWRRPDVSIHTPSL
jgi:hypothetical protein